MRHVVIDRLGDLADLVVREGPEPELDDASVLVDLRASVVSYVNAVLARGQYQVPPPVPFVPGTTGVGVVAQVGSAVSDVTVGDRVALTRLSGGCWSTRIRVDPALLAPVPQPVPDALAAAVLEAWVTMHFALTRRRPVRAGEVVLVLGASGAIGSAAVDIARAAGARVVAVCRDRGRLAPGVAEAVDVVDPGDGLTAAVRARFPEGVDVVVDPVGGDLATESLKLLAPGGAFLVLGFASGDIPRLGANRVLIANRDVVGVDLGHAITGDPALGRTLMGEVLERVADGAYAADLLVRECGLAEVPPALRSVAEGEARGLVVARIDRP